MKKTALPLPPSVPGKPRKRRVRSSKLPLLEAPTSEDRILPPESPPPSFPVPAEEPSSPRPPKKRLSKAPARSKRTRKARQSKASRQGNALGRWLEKHLRLWHWVNRVPSPLLTLIICLCLGLAVVAANLVYQVIRKPAELLSPVSNVLIKTPTGTWKSYGPLFRHYATASIPAELLAALAQVESAGNPVAHTYWRWSLSSPDLFGIYRPASSSVGLYQMTDPAFADAQRYCIHKHIAVPMSSGAAQEACGFGGQYFRIIPGHAIELTSAFLDRGVAALLKEGKGHTATPQQKRDVATILHLCGAGPAKSFVHHGFHLTPAAHCGDHDPAVYLAQVNAMEKQFQRLAAN